MEKLFGISYPTVKNRLNAIAGRLEFVDINPPSSRSEILEMLDKRVGAPYSVHFDGCPPSFVETRRFGCGEPFPFLSRSGIHQIA
jgi:hypothetical protein